MNLRFSLDEPESFGPLPRQLEAARTLATLELARLFKDFTPVLAGTIPLAIDLPESDLDILCFAPDFLCFAPDLRIFAAHCQKLAPKLTDYRERQMVLRGIPSFVASGRFENFELEIFAQPVPVHEQWGYRHLLIEARLLKLAGEPLRLRIIELKQAGLKTEPAFAHCLQLPSDPLLGDPFAALLELEALDDEQLCQLIDHQGLF